jgi:hypothetical protein
MNIATDIITVFGTVTSVVMSWVRGKCSKVCLGWWGISIPAFVIAIVGLVSSISSLSEDTTKGFAIIAHWGVGFGCWLAGSILFLISFCGCVGKDSDEDQDGEEGH